MTYICASVKTLETLRMDCDAKLIRDIWKAKDADDLAGVYPQAGEIVKNIGGYHRNSLLRIKRECVNHAGGFHGVEYMGWHKRLRQHVEYCNAGDSYAGTIAFIGKRLVVTTWGDMVERGRITEPEY